MGETASPSIVKVSTHALPTIDILRDEPSKHKSDGINAIEVCVRKVDAGFAIGVELESTVFKSVTPSVGARPCSSVVRVR